MLRRLLLLGLLAALAPSAAAQAPDPRIAQAAEARARNDFQTAERLLRSVVEERPDDAQAHYELGRVLADDANPQRDEGAARGAVGRASSLEPNNVVYLVAELEALRRDSWNFFVDRFLARKRAGIARRLLALDPANSYAHEELGIAAVRDYYQYRNAVRVPSMSANGLRPVGSAFNGEDLYGTGQFNDRTEVAGGAADPNNPDSEGPSDGGILGDTGPVDRGAIIEQATTGEVYARNRFDLDALEAQGVLVTTYEDRAREALDAAQRHLDAALDADPRRREVYDHIVRLAAIAQEYPRAERALRSMYAYFPDDAHMWLYLGLVNHRLGNWDASDAAFRNGIERLSQDDREAFTDLTLILPPDEWGAFREDPEGYAEAYWASRDPRFLNTVNERRTEHYARLVYADLLYRSDDLDLPGWKTERGEIHARYGLPESDVVIEGGYGAVVEAFPQRNPAFNVSQEEREANRFNVWDYGDLFFVFEDPNRNGEYQLYSPPADLYAVRTGQGLDELDFVLRTREAIRETPERYTFETPGRDIRLPYRVAAFKGDGGQADLYLGFGIPVAAVDGDVGLTVSTAAALIGPERDVLAERRRTVYGLRAAQIVDFDETRLWTGVERLSAGAGEHEVQLEFETAAGSVAASQRQRVEVPDFGEPGLQLSDILLAYYVEEAEGAEPGRVVRDGLSMQPAPWGLYAVDDPIHVYFELYGLGLSGGRSDFEVEARLVPKDTSTGLGRIARRILGSRERGVSTAAEAQGSRSDDSQSLILDASTQEPGLYTLTVVVRDRVSGETAERETDLLLE